MKFSAIRVISLIIVSIMLLFAVRLAVSTDFREDMYEEYINMACKWKIGDFASVVNSQNVERYEEYLPLGTPVIGLGYETTYGEVVKRLIEGQFQSKKTSGRILFEESSGLKYTELYKDSPYTWYSAIAIIYLTSEKYPELDGVIEGGIIFRFEKNFIPVVDRVMLLSLPKEQPIESYMLGIDADVN